MKKSDKKITFTTHQKAAISWLVFSSFLILPLLSDAKRPDAGTVLGYGVVLLTVEILLVQILLQWTIFRQWFCWTDALSDNQRQSLAQNNFSRYYQHAFEDDYTRRSLPYIIRILVVMIIMETIALTLPADNQHAFLLALKLFASLYPCGVAILIIASWPLGKLFRLKKGKQ